MNEYKKKLIIYIVLAAAVLAVYWQVHQFDFVNIDDNIYVTENYHIKSGITLASIRWALTTTYAEFWHPLTWLSLMADYELYGLHAGGYHLTNLVLHILSTLLLFWLFHRMTGALWKSAFVAAFFALHPLHVESVAWVSERKDVLSAFFWMLTLCLYVYYAEKPVIRRYVLVALAFICALMSKPMVVTLPLIMILLDYWPLRRFENQNRLSDTIVWQLKEKLPLMLLSLLLVVATFYTPGDNASYELLPLQTRLANAPVAFVTYLAKTFWPQDMAIFYPFPSQIPVWQITGAILLIIIMTAAVLATAKRLPHLFVGWFWFIITIAPVIGILQIGDFAMADRYHYLPSIGIAIMLAWEIPHCIKREVLRKNILWPVALVFLASLAFLAWQQCAYWKNNIELWNHAIQATEDNYMAHNNLGLALFTEGKANEAIAHYNQVIRIRPFDAVPRHNKGVVYTRSGQYQMAIENYDEAIRVNPDDAEAYHAKGNIYLGLGQHQKAVGNLSKAIALKPDNPAIYYNRGTAYIHLAQYQQAIADYSKAVALNPAYFDAYNNRAFIYLRLGRYQQAVEDYSQAIRLKPDYADAYNNRGFVHLLTGNMEAGCRDAHQACNMGTCSTLQLANGKGLCR